MLYSLGVSLSNIQTSLMKCDNCKIAKKMQKIKKSGKEEILCHSTGWSNT